MNSFLTRLKISTGVYVSSRSPYSEITACRNADSRSKRPFRGFDKTSDKYYPAKLTADDVGLYSSIQSIKFPKLSAKELILAQEYSLIFT